MPQSIRFGRRLPLPSTADIKHELRLMATADRLRDALTDRLGPDATGPARMAALVDDLRAHGLSGERARSLIERCGLVGRPVAVAAP